jgi:hypothetical protein
VVLFLGAAEEAAERVDKLVVDGTSAKIVSLVFHRRNLDPFVLPDEVLLYRVQALLP